jgi:catechol 2,3-dioxygenase
MAIGYVKLLMREPEEAIGFFEELGLVSEEQGGAPCLRPRGGECIIYIVDRGELPTRGNYVYHVAINLASRNHLAGLMGRLRVEGAADHLVSESLYATGPGGVGLEFYVDKPRDEWIVSGDGTYIMDVRPLDIESILREPPADNPMDGSRVGHVHLRVSRVDVGREFYSFLGLRITGKYMGAVFMALGDYHHHIALNNWPVPAPAPGFGLIGFSIDYPDMGSLMHAAEKLGVEPRDGVIVKDPYGFNVELRVR